jgi:hypothetical protein
VRRPTIRRYQRRWREGNPASADRGLSGARVCDGSGCSSSCAGGVADLPLHSWSWVCSLSR